MFWILAPNIKKYNGKKEGGYRRADTLISELYVRKSVESVFFILITFLKIKAFGKLKNK